MCLLIPICNHVRLPLIVSIFCSYMLSRQNDTNLSLEGEMRVGPLIGTHILCLVSLCSQHLYVDTDNHTTVPTGVTMRMVYSVKGGPHYPARACAKGLRNRFYPSVSQSVSQSVCLSVQ